MVDAGVLPDDEVPALQQRPLGLVGAVQGPPRTGDAYRTQVRRELAALLGDDVPYDRGLTVHTAYDPDVQALAEDAVRDAARACLDRQVRRGRVEPPAPGEPMPVQGAAVVLDNATGDVLALVGGYTDPLGGLVRATQSPRQPGSTFKVFVYAAALSEGLRPYDTVLDEPLSLPTGTGSWWAPANYGGTYRGEITLSRALAASSNVAAVRVAKAVGMPAVVAAAHRMGVDSDLRDDLSVALGSSEVTVLEPRHRLRHRRPRRRAPAARFVTEVTDRAGAQLLPAPPAPEAVLDPEVAERLRKMMAGVVRYGTGHDAYRPQQERIGKTGTTDDNVDAWFVGATPRHTIAVWIGRDDNQPLGPRETGSETALAGLDRHRRRPRAAAAGAPPEHFPPVPRGGERAAPPRRRGGPRERAGPRADLPQRAQRGICAPGGPMRGRWPVAAPLLLPLAGCLSELPDLADPCAAWPDPGLYRVTVEQDDDKDRRPYVYVPAGPGPRDVVVLLHGGGMSGPKIEEVTGFEALADREGFALVYPNGLGWPLRSWNAGRSDQETDHDDVTFLDRLTRQISGKVCGDRVLAAGFSNGSMMAQRWACEGQRPPDAVGASSGTLAVPRCDGPPLPIRYYHGTADPIVPYDGGELRGLPVASVEASMALWRARNRCEGDGEVVQRGDTTCETWSCEASTVQCSVAGWKHQWPGGIHSDLTDADATGQIWKWFDEVVPSSKAATSTTPATPTE
ncbi:MAG: penicillin-binding transpeptidase domain-containing protein [Myxococcota bacterium]